ncbi:hypothetical protein HV782_013950 [Pseudomonas monsensis]|uniref:hypothetical protein n=1 Tax=Pseudomonas monsensis TaxID=2745509 RepID=UPI0016480250|nr:hypothetical protein [Pseudomonas monsensis]QXI03025.1 hypothetical protein HV782_013950 [Pseudomonas monsensis]
MTSGLMSSAVPGIDTKIEKPDHAPDWILLPEKEMTPEKKAIQIANARAHVKADCDAEVDTEASAEALRSAISASLRGSIRGLWASLFAFKLFPEGQAANPHHLELVEQLEELIANDVMALPASERDSRFEELDALVDMLQI